MTPAKIDIDLDQLELMLNNGLTQAECAEVLGCSTQLINARVREGGISYKRRYANNGFDTRKINRFGENRSGRKPKVNSLQQDDMNEIEAEFKTGWDKSYGYTD